MLRTNENHVSPDYPVKKSHAQGANLDDPGIT